MNDDLADRVWQGMRTLVLERHDRRREVCEALGMSFIRAKALRLIAAATGPQTMRELSAGLAIDPPYTTLVVHDLERRGLVTRSAHPADRRRKVVTATPEGKAAAGLASRILNEPPAAVRGLDPADLAALDRIVTKLLAPAPVVRAG
jgi:DNA-binding MarR family transcriptional regulator